MAGWGVAWLAPLIGLKAVIFDPRYSTTCGRPKHLDVLDFHRSKWKELGADILPVDAGMVKVNYNICKNELEKKYPNSIMLPLGLPFEETVEETARIAHWYDGHFKNVVVCIGSGTICAGLVRGLPSAKVIGIMSRSPGSKKAAIIKGTQILEKSGVLIAGLFGRPDSGLSVFDPGWQYTEPSENPAPFPCHPYYDLKAWEWLTDHVKELEPPILFWNIGS